MERTPEDIRDELLVFECQDGSEEAFKTLIRRWEPRLVRLASHLVGDREAVGDIVQETWLAVVRRIGRLDDPARFRSWVFRIAANKCKDWIRRRSVRRRRMRELGDEETLVEAEEGTDGSARTTQVRRALATMPESQRVVLSLHYLDGMS
ncbi:MAG: sigma-70 family RNA polymerase sigma factor, partial [Planctomycetota bacterium]